MKQEQEARGVEEGIQAPRGAGRPLSRRRSSLE